MPHTTFAVRLRTMRRIRGLNQQIIADALHISRSNYSAYERGAAEPSIQTLIQLATFFRVTVDFLVGFDLKTNQPSFTTKQAQLWEYISSTDDETITLMLQFLQAITKK